MAVCLVGACSDDEDDDDGLGTGGSAGIGAGAAPTGGLTASCDPAGDGACQNETDCAFVLSGQLESAAYQCADQCFAEQEPEACAVDCVRMELGASEACSSCFADLAACADEFCFVACFPDPESSDCRDCLELFDCSTELEICGGVTLD